MTDADNVRAVAREVRMEDEALIAQLKAQLRQAEKELANEKNEWRMACKLMDEVQAKLRQEREANSLILGRAADYEGRFKASEAQVSQLQTTVSQLTKALRKSSEQHHTWCPFVSDWPRGSKPCICPKSVADAALAHAQEINHNG